MQLFVRAVSFSQEFSRSLGYSMLTSISRNVLSLVLYGVFDWHVPVVLMLHGLSDMHSSLPKMLILT